MRGIGGTEWVADRLPSPNVGVGWPTCQDWENFMSYDEGLAERIREALCEYPAVSEKKMFGGLAFMHRGYMFVGIVGKALMARVGPDSYAVALSKPNVREMDFTGRPMKGYVFVDPPGLEQDAELSAWIEGCLAFVQSLAPKKMPK